MIKFIVTNPQNLSCLIFKQGNKTRKHYIQAQGVLSDTGFFNATTENLTVEFEAIDSTKPHSFGLIIQERNP